MRQTQPSGLRRRSGALFWLSRYSHSSRMSSNSGGGCLHLINRSSKLITTNRSVSSAAFAPAVPQMLAEFHSKSETGGTIAVSIYMLGLAIGPFLLGPLSEVHGRAPVYLLSGICFVAFTIACGLSENLGVLIASRFLCGLFGAAPIVLGGATIADIFLPEDRAKAMAIWGIGPILGPVLGPVFAGFQAEAHGWRSVFWLLAIAALVALAVGTLFLKETYVGAILEDRQRLLPQMTDAESLKPKQTLEVGQKKHFSQAILHPLKIIIASPVVLLLSLYVGLLYGTLYLLITTFTRVFGGTYGLKVGEIGLTFLGTFPPTPTPPSQPLFANGKD